MPLTQKPLNEFGASEHLCEATYEVLEDFSRKDSVWTNCFFKEVGLKAATFDRMEIKYSRMDQCYFRGARFINVDFTGSRFVDCNLRNASFQDCKLWYVTFTQCILDYDNVLQSLPEELNIRCQLLRTLRLNAFSMGEFRTADDLLLREMQADRNEQWNILLLASAWHRNRYSTSDRLQALRRWCIHHLEYHIWGYGVKIFSIPRACVVVVLINSTLLWATRTTLLVTPNPEMPQSLPVCIYATIVAFSTIGFGDAVSTSLFGRLVLSLTGLIGPVFLGLFAAAAYRRIQR